MTEAATLGRQEKEYINTFKTGKCPTCGHDIDTNILEERKQKMLEYASTYKHYEAINKELEEKHNNDISGIQEHISSIKQQIQEIDSTIAHYNNSIKLVTENYDDIISEYEEKIIMLEEQIEESDKHIGEWNDMNELLIDKNIIDDEPESDEYRKIIVATERRTARMTSLGSTPCF